MSLLKERLSGMTPADSDQYLSNLWRSFQGTEQHDALVLLLENIASKHLKILLTQRLYDSERSFSAGAAACAHEVLSAVNAAFAFDPSKAEYSLQHSHSGEPVEDEPPDEEPVY